MITSKWKMPRWKFTPRSRSGNDNALRHAGIMFTSYLMTGFFSYLYRVFIGRSLNPGDFGVFGALFGIFYILGVLEHGLSTSTARFTSQLSGETETIRLFLNGLLKRVIIFESFVFILYLFTVPLTAGFLRIEAPALILLVAVNFLFSLPLSLNLGSLHGHERFALLAGFQVGHSLLKLMCGIILVKSGFGLFGAISALAIASILTMIGSFISNRQFQSIRSSGSERYDFNPFYKYFFPAILFSFCFASTSNIDVILARAFFPGRSAGLYTAASVIGKIQIFLSFGICAASFPKISRAHSLKNSTSRYMKQSLLYSLLSTGSLALIFWLQGAKVIGLMFGPRYADAAPLVKWYGIAALLFSTSIVILNYYTAKGEMKHVHFFAGLTVLEMALIWNIHGSMIQVIKIILGINIAFLLLCAGYALNKFSDTGDKGQ
jgi:O-antigen/teichoic acid export membrane protein